MKCLHLSNVTIVEPFVQESVIGGLKSQYINKLKFSDIFDLETFNYVSHSEGAADIVPYSTYLHHAPRKAIFVKLVLLRTKEYNSSQLPPPEIVWSTPPGSDKCYQPPTPSAISPPVYQDGHVYCYVRIVRAFHKILNHHIITAEQFYSTVLGGGELKGVTVVLSYWRTPWQLGRCPEVTTTPPKVQDSPQLLAAVEKYREQFDLGGREYVGVMLRSEHAYLKIQSDIRFNRPSGYTVQRCLDEALAKTQTVMAERGTSRVFVTADVGRYGTSSWKDSLHGWHKDELPNITAHVERTVQRLYSGRWSFHQWEHSFSEATDGVEDRGYVAAVQRVLASQAACLILVGGGSFQRLSLTNYLQQNQPQPPCVHMVCMDRMYESQFNQQISNYRA